LVFNDEVEAVGMNKGQSIVKSNHIETEVVQDLVLRLAQVEAAFEAVINSEVDAVLDPDSKTPILLKEAVDELRKTEQKLRAQNEILKTTQDHLLKERQRYHDLFEFAPDGYLVTDATGIILEANQAASGLLASRQEELAGKSLISYIVSEDHQTFEAMLSQVIKSEKVCGWESIIQLKEGLSIPIVLIVASKQESWGSPLVLRWQLHDISERKRAAESLIASQQKLHSIISNAPLLLWAVDLNKVITYLDGKALFTLGVKSQDFLGRHISEFLIDCPQILEHIDLTLSGEEQVGTLNIGEVVFETRYSLLRDLRGEVSGVIGVAFDISTQKQLEIDLAEMSRSLVQAREEDRLGLSRELHDGPVQDMYGVMFHLKAFTDGLPSSVNRGPVEIIHTSLQQVIDKLRTICGELHPPTLVPFGLEKAIRSHAAAFMEANPGIELELDLMADGKQIPEIDRLALFRIYHEAMTNIARHANAGKTRVRLELSDEMVSLTIQDDGDGFTLPDKWIEFARSNRMGIIDMLERAEALGGELKITTAPGKGTELKMIFPRVHFS
jgi:PAS domain S-box-containing protein